MTVLDAFAIDGAVAAPSACDCVARDLRAARVADDREDADRLRRRLTWDATHVRPYGEITLNMTNRLAISDTPPPTENSPSFA